MITSDNATFITQKVLIRIRKGRVILRLGVEEVCSNVSNV